MASLVERQWAPGRDNLLSNSDRKPGKYLAYVPDELELELGAFSPEVEAIATQALGALIRADERLSKSAKQLNFLLLRSESISSSWIEGKRITPKKLAIAEALKSGSKVAVEVIANIRATERSVEQLASRDRQVTLEDLLQLHATVDPDNDRDLRTYQNFVGGTGWSPLKADFVPPPETEVPRLVSNLLSFINSTGANPVIRAALAHAQFETIHPFADGNGRTGRAIIHAILKREGVCTNSLVPISSVFASKSNNYIAGLTAYRRDALGVAEWIVAFSEAVILAAEEAVQFGLGVERVREGLFDRYLEFRRSQQRNPLQPRTGALILKVLDVLPECPVLTNVSVAELFNTTRQAAFGVLGELVSAGVLKANKDQKGRVTSYSADAYLELIDTKH